MLLTQQDIYIRAGSTETFTVTVTDANGAAVDCTGAELRMQIRDGATGALLASAGCAWTNAAGGIGVAVFDATSTGAITYAGTVISDFERHAYAVEVAFATGEVETVAAGFAFVQPEGVK